MNKHNKERPLSLSKIVTCVMVLFFLLTVNWGYAQTGVAIKWNKEVGCQTYSQEEDPRDPKDPIFLEDIADGTCIKVCEKSVVTYTLVNLPVGSTTTWTAIGGAIASPTNTTCNVTWNAAGNGSISFNITTPGGVISKTICIERIIIPKAEFSVTGQGVAGNANLFAACVNQTVYFTNASTDLSGSALVSYLWDFGDGTTSSAFEPSHIYANPKTYTVILTVTNACNCSVSIKKDIVIKGTGFEIICPSVVCEREKVTYSLPFEGREICRDNYLWSVIGGQILSQANGSVEVLWDHVPASGFGYLTFDPSLCRLSCLTPTTIKIPIIKSNGTITGDNTICYKSQARYELPQWPTTDIQWEILGNESGNLAQIILTDQRNEIIVRPLFEGVLTLRATYMNTLLHCGGSAELSIKVTKPFDFSGQTVVCQNNFSSFTTDEGNVTNWVLTNSSGVTVSSQSNTSTFTYNYPATGTFSLTAGNASGCPSQQKNITVVPLPATPTGITGEVLICPDAPYVYSVDNPDPDSIYIWEVSNGSSFLGSNTGTQVSIQFGAVAPYTVKVYRKSINPAVCRSLPFTLAVNKKQIAAEISAANATVCANAYATYTANQMGSSIPYTEGDIYTWSVSPAELGSISTGQGTNSVNVLWNNVPAITPVTLTLVIKKCTITETFPKQVQILPTPVIAINSPTSVCSGAAITFNVVSTNGAPLNGGTVVTWDFGNGTGTVVGAPGATSYTHVFNNTSSGNIGYNVTASVSNANGCIGTSNTANQSVAVLPGPPASASLTSLNGNVFCYPEEVTAVITAATSANATIQWLQNGTPIGVTTPTLTIGPELNFGLYSFIATNPVTGCSTVSNNINIQQWCVGAEACTISPYPTVTNNAGYSCGTITLNGSTSITPLSEEWDIFGPVDHVGYTGATLPVTLAGQYNVFYKAVYECTNGELGTISPMKVITVPYIPDFAYTVTCNNNSTFTVTFVDKTNYFAQTTHPPAVFGWRVGAGTWTNISGNTITLSPGNNYQFRVQVNGTIYGEPQPMCEKILSGINLAVTPNQSIVITRLPSCHDTSVGFGISNPSSTDTYLWTFDNGAQNRLKDPERVFNTSGTYTVQVVVTNRFGCSRLLTSSVIIPEPCFNGDITSTPNPPSVCQGQSMTLNYVSSATTPDNSQYVWMNGNTAISPAVNAPSLSVSTPGFYWLKLLSVDNCRYDTPTVITPSFKSAPSVKLKGEATVCEGSAFTIEAITEATAIQWFLDGSLQSAWNNSPSMELIGLTLGSHTITATVSHSGCSTTAAHAIMVNPAPEVPVLAFTKTTCEPYRYKITASVAGNTTLNWSNGQIGTSINVSEGGPYKVTSTVGNCSVSAQIDLPKNPSNYTWIFPQGCFENCEKDEGIIIGPRLPLHYWGWNYNTSTVINSGTDTFPQPLEVDANGIYSMTVNTGDCQITSNTLNYSGTTCEKCELLSQERVRITPKQVPYCAFTMTLDVFSSYSTTQWISLISPDADYIISPATVQMLPNTDNHFVLTLIPLNGFNGATTFILQNTDSDNKTCQNVLNITVPDCSDGNSKNSTVSVPEANEMKSQLLLHLYPNPATESVSIDYENCTVGSSIAIYDLTGRKLAGYNTTEAKGSWNVNTGSFPGGLYVVVVKENDVVITQQKLIIK